MEIKKFVFNPFQENTYLVSDEEGSCVIIDPGCYHSEEREALKQYIENKKLKPLHLLNTHCHVDHVFGNAFVNRTWNLPLSAHRLDLPTLQMVPQACMLYGLKGYEPSPEPTVFLEHGDVVKCGSLSFEVLFVPGHAPGHVAFVDHQNRYVINGDVLFQGSVGRMDLPGGDAETLKKSILEVMYQLPDDYVVYCGHGPETTIGAEKQFNSFVKA